MGGLFSVPERTRETEDSDRSWPVGTDSRRSLDRVGWKRIFKVKFIVDAMYQNVYSFIEYSGDLNTQLVWY